MNKFSAITAQALDLSAHTQEMVFDAAHEPGGGPTPLNVIVVDRLALRDDLIKQMSGIDVDIQRLIKEGAEQDVHDLIVTLGTLVGDIRKILATEFSSIMFDDGHVFNRKAT